MSAVERAELVNGIFEDVAERLGDITRPVMDRAYAECPEARRSFEAHGLGEKLSDLEAVMVEQTLYCVMNWVDAPGAAMVTLDQTVPHHAETLEVPLPFFWSIFAALFDLVAESIPDSEVDRHKAWRDIQSEIQDYTHNEIVLT